MLLKLFLKLWGDENPQSDVRDIDLIVPISYTTKRDELVDATKENLLRAVAYKKIFPTATVVVSNCAYTFPGAELAEEKFKRQILEKESIEFVSAAAMNNSVQEAEQIRKALDFEPRRILIVTGQMHARSARLIWGKIFPAADIVVRCIDYKSEWQKDHPVRVQRNAYVWAFANVARHILIRTFGLSFVARLHHRAT